MFFQSISATVASNPSVMYVAIARQQSTKACTHAGSRSERDLPAMDDPRTLQDRLASKYVR